MYATCSSTTPTPYTSNIFMIERERERERAGIMARIHVTFVRVGKGIQEGRCLLGRQVGKTRCSFFPSPNYSDTIVQQ